MLSPLQRINFSVKLATSLKRFWIIWGRNIFKLTYHEGILIYHLLQEDCKIFYFQNQVKQETKDEVLEPSKNISENGANNAEIKDDNKINSNEAVNGDLKNSLVCNPIK